jgi:glutathione S-transferase
MDWQLSTLAPANAPLFRAYLREPKETIPAADLAAAAKKTGEAWGIVDAQLAQTPFVAGAELTVGDIAFGNAIHRWYAYPVERPVLPNLKAWYDRLCTRPAYRRNILED